MIVGLCGLVLYVGTRLGIAEPTLIAKRCVSADCADLIEGFAPNCPEDEYGGRWCDLSYAGGTVIFCTYHPNRSCELVEPTQANSCTGFCEDDPVTACVILWSVCYDPNQ